MQSLSDIRKLAANTIHSRNSANLLVQFRTIKFTNASKEHFDMWDEFNMIYTECPRFVLEQIIMTSRNSHGIIWPQEIVDITQMFGVV